uniref:Proliferating cell nuclear antigen n=1 Tax=Pithovirus LCPAC304 TaxID=2506594 RepID=A0A481ZB71_9VIRU|nr:MAG: proliferating cell nuclear antigen [Pithovirus LCPAC304]
MHRSEDPPLIDAHFTDGYSFRNVLGFYRQTCTRTNIIFTKDKIMINEADATDTILVDCTIETDDLTEYKYNVRDEDGNLIEALACGFTTLEMQKATKMVGKKDAIRLYTKKEENPKIYIQVVHAGSKSDNNIGLRIVSIIEVEVNEFQDIVYQRSSPNARAASTEFAKICADFSSLKCTDTTVIGFEEGIVFQGIESGTLKSVESYGNIPDRRKLLVTEKYSIPTSSSSTSKPKLSVTLPGEVCRVRINAKTIRAMTKFNNLSPTGVIKFFLEEGSPLKIVSPIGCYGKLVLYLKDSVAE